MREEYDSRGHTSPRNQTKELTWKKSDKTEDQTRDQTPQCARDMDNCLEVLRNK